MTAIAESEEADVTQAWLQGLDYYALHGPAIAADKPGAERTEIPSQGKCSRTVDQIPHQVRLILMEHE